MHFSYVSQTHAILVDIHEFNILVVGNWHSVIHSNCQITFESMVYFHELFFFHSYYSLGYLTIIQCSVVLTFETPEKEWRKMFWMTVKRASRTKNFVIAEEQHVNIEYIYCVTSFFEERTKRKSAERSNSSINTFFPVSFIKHIQQKRKCRKNKTARKSCRKHEAFFRQAYNHVSWIARLPTTQELCGNYLLKLCCLV